jgi:hypothetical protein
VQPLSQTIIFLIPVFNDWQALNSLLPEILKRPAISQYSEVHFVLVDDHSDEKRDLEPEGGVRLKTSFTVLQLARNMGHQIAIAIGLHYIQEHFDFKHLVVLDADGQDNPADIDSLIALAAEHPDCVIAARRISRVESAGFTALYYLHRSLTRLLTGKIIAFGNYLLLTPQNLKLVVNSPSSWVSFSGTVAKQAPCLAYVNSTRLGREKGSSKMSFSKLLMHSLRINSVFTAVIAVRILLFSLLAIGLSMLLPSLLSAMFLCFIIVPCILSLLILTGIKVYFENFGAVPYEKYVLKSEGIE